MVIQKGRPVIADSMYRVSFIDFYRMSFIDGEKDQNYPS